MAAAGRAVATNLMVSAYGAARSWQPNEIYAKTRMYPIWISLLFIGVRTCHLLSRAFSP